MKRDALKAKTCKVCREQFLPFKSMQMVCGGICAQAWANRVRLKREAAEKARQQKTERNESQARRMALLTRSDWLRKCQAIANKYARIRDRHDGCISCDKPASWRGQWHGSHFRSVGAASAVRLNLLNIHKACSVCNNYLSGNLLAYRPRLVAKISLERVEWLESQNHRADFSVEYLKRYQKTIGKRLRRMEAKAAEEK